VRFEPERRSFSARKLYRARSHPDGESSKRAGIAWIVAMVSSLGTEPCITRDADPSNTRWSPEAESVAYPFFTGL
jgi:hypothetical protein